MTGFQGMDTAQVEDYSGLLGDRSGTIEDRFSTLEGMVRAIVGAQWVGPDADVFGERYGSEVMTTVRTALEQLQRRVDELRGHIEEQDSASDAADGGFLEGVFSALGEAIGTVGSFLGDAWKHLTEDILPTVHDVISTGLGNIGTAIKNGIDDALKHAPDLGKQAGKRLLGSAIPYVGDAYTGIVAGVERWQQDGENHPDMGFGARLGRAALDGGANFAGSLGGGLLGTAAGGALGGALGGLIGGGGGAVATSPTGPGAAVGGAAGGGGGAAVGTAIGGYAGDVIGSYFGGRLADAGIDALLD